MSTPDLHTGAAILALCLQSDMLYRKIRFWDADWIVPWWSRMVDGKLFHVFEATNCDTCQAISWDFVLSSTEVQSENSNSMGSRTWVYAAFHIRDELTHFTEVLRSKPVDTFEDLTAQLVLISLSDRRPVQLIRNDVRNMIILTLTYTCNIF